MILSDKIPIKIGSAQQRKYFREKGFDCNFNDIIIINPLLLPKYSHTRILVKCENCGMEKMIIYSDYLKCIKKQNIYYCSKCKRIKTDKTNIEKYGFITNLKCEDTKNKIKETCLEKYGVDNFAKTNKSKEKVKQTCLEKYGSESYTQSNDYKNIVKKSMDKSKITCLEKYGVENVSQSEEIQNKILSSSYQVKKYKDLYYQGTYEFHFLVNFYDKLKIKKQKSIKYNYNGKTKIYFPDFYLPDYNLIVEIKSKYTYNLNKEQNECKKLGVLENGYNFIFIIDKNYDNFNELIMMI